MTREIGAVVLGLAVAALALREALGLPIGTVRNPGEGFFPLWLAVLLVALSLLLLGHALRARAAAGARGDTRIGQVIGLVAALAVNTAMLEWVGYPIATFLLVLYMVKVTHPQRWLLALAVSLLAAAVGSFIAGTIGVVGLMLLAPPLASFALKFGAPENAALLILGLLMVGYLGGASMTKGLMMAVVGLLLGSVGLDPIQGTPRFTYGIFKLSEGFDFVLVAMALFGIGEVLASGEQTEEPEVITTKIGGLLATREEWKAAAAPMARGSLLGFIIGVLPGGGAIISSFLSYALEKRFSRHPERFGKGAIEGVAAPEAANNGAASSSFIPLLTLGIPGNASIALIFAALLIHGLRPGPLLVAQQPQLFWGLIASMYIGNVMLLVLNLPLIRVWVRLLQVPYAQPAPV